MDAVPPIRPTPRWPKGTAENLITLWNQAHTSVKIGLRLSLPVRAVESKVRKLRAAGHVLEIRRPTKPRKLGRTTRRCLHCGRNFPSSHVDNRICEACLDDGPFSSGLAWAQGGTARLSLPE